MARKLRDMLPATSPFQDLVGRVMRSGSLQALVLGRANHDIGALQNALAEVSKVGTRSRRIASPKEVENRSQAVHFSTGWPSNDKRLDQLGHPFPVFAVGLGGQDDPSSLIHELGHNLSYFLGWTHKPQYGQVDRDLSQLEHVGSADRKYLQPNSAIPTLVRGTNGYVISPEDRWPDLHEIPSTLLQLWAALHHPETSTRPGRTTDQLKKMAEVEKWMAAHPMPGTKGEPKPYIGEGERAFLDRYVTGLFERFAQAADNPANHIPPLPHWPFTE